jgi:hypothetical protein
LPRLTAAASYERMWQTFQVLCQWPVHNEAPFLDTIQQTLAAQLEATHDAGQ